MKEKFIISIKTNKWLIVIMLVAIILRFYKINFQSLWLDEIYTMNITSPKFSLREFYNEVVAKEGFPFLYFLLLKIGYLFFGYSEIVARSFSAFAGVISVYAIYRFGKDLMHKDAGLLASLLLAVNEYHIFISQDARPYTFYFLAAIFAFYRLALLLKNHTLRNAIYYGLAAALLVNVNFFGFLNLFTQAILIICLVLLSPKDNRIRLLKYAAIAGFIAIILFLPNYEMVAKLLKIQSFWVPAATEESFTIITKEFLGSSEFIVFIVSALSIYYIFRVFNTKSDLTYSGIVNNKRIFTFVLYFTWFLVFVYFLIVKSLIGVSVTIARYFVSTLPVLFLVLGTSLYLIKNKVAKTLSTISLIVIMCTNMVIVRHFYNRTSRTQFREAAAFVANNNKDGQIVYTERKYWFDFYLNKDKENYRIVDTPLETVVTDMRNDPSKIKAFWYINAHQAPFTISEESKNFVNQNFYLENNFDGMDAWGRHYVLIKDMPIVNVDKFKPFKPVNGDVFKYSVETNVVQDGKLMISGWAFFEGIDSNGTRIDVMLIDKEKNIRGNTLTVIRNDINEYFNSTIDLSRGGFSFIIDLNDVPENYQIGIVVNNKQNHKEGMIVMTGK